MKISSILIISVAVFLSCTSPKQESVGPYTIGSVSEDSTVITFKYADFQKEVAKVDRYNRIVLGKEYDAKARENAVNTLFTRILSQLKLHHETDYLGIDVSDAELKQLFSGEIVHNSIKEMPIFKNPETQKFDPARVELFIDRIKKAKSADPLFTWEYHLDELREKVIREKYEALLDASYIQTDVERTWYTELVRGVSSIQVAFLPYKVFSDTVEPSDDQVRKAIEAESYNYQTQEKRFLKIAEVPIRIHKHFHEKEFKTLERYLSTVGSLVEIAKQNADIKQFSSYYTPASVPENLKVFFENGKVGDRHGPYFENNSFRVIQIDNIQPSPDEVKAQHLVIKGIDKAKIQTIRDEIEARVKKGEDFMALAEEYTKPYDFDGKFGDLGWFRYAEMIKPFSDAAFYNPAGQLVVAESEYGWHVINIQEHKNISNKYSFTALYWPLKASNEDIQASMEAAKSFANSISDPLEFVDKAIENRYVITEAAASSLGKELESMANTGEVFQWAFHHNEGDISQPYFIDGKIYVFQIELVSPPGLMAFREAKEFIMGDVATNFVKELAEKRYDFERLNQLSFEESANELGMNVHNITGIGFQQDELANVGTDLYTVGLATVAQPGEVSKLYFGNKGLIQFKKLSEQNIVASVEYPNIKGKAWDLQMSNRTYELVFRLNDHMKINKVRKQDTYFLVPTQHGTLTNDKNAAELIFMAEHAFRMGDYKKALYGDSHFKGFEELSKQLEPSKQQRLSLIYAGISALHLQEYQKAIELLNPVNSDDRFFSVIAKGLQGDAYAQLNDFENAVQKYEEAINTKSNFMTNGMYLTKLMAIAHRNGDYQKAYAYVKMIEEKYPQSYVMTDLAKYKAIYKYLVEKDTAVR